MQDGNTLSNGRALQTAVLIFSIKCMATSRLQCSYRQRVASDLNLYVIAGELVGPIYIPGIVVGMLTNIIKQLAVEHQPEIV